MMTHRNPESVFFRRAMRYLWLHLEGIIWLSVLVTMFFTSPAAAGHFSACPLALSGIEHCPGCGLGRSMIFALNGDVLSSLQMHPLGLLAIVLLVLRIVQILNPNLKSISL